MVDLKDGFSFNSENSNKILFCLERALDAEFSREADMISVIKFSFAFPLNSVTLSTYSLCRWLVSKLNESYCKFLSKQKMFSLIFSKKKF